jgi:hypothetical protein
MNTETTRHRTEEETIALEEIRHDLDRIAACLYKWAKMYAVHFEKAFFVVDADHDGFFITVGENLAVVAEEFRIIHDRMDAHEEKYPKDFPDPEYRTGPGQYM